MTAGWPLVWRSALHGVMEGPGKPSWCLMLYLVWPEIFCAMVVMSWILGYGSNLRRGADSNRLSSSKAAYSAPSEVVLSTCVRVPITYTYLKSAGIIYSWVLITLRGAGSLINTLTSKGGPGLVVQVLADRKHAGALMLPGLMLLLERVTYLSGAVPQSWIPATFAGDLLMLLAMTVCHTVELAFVAIRSPGYIPVGLSPALLMVEHILGCMFAACVAAAVNGIVPWRVAFWPPAWPSLVHGALLQWKAAWSWLASKARRRASFPQLAASSTDAAGKAACAEVPALAKTQTQHLKSGSVTSTVEARACSPRTAAAAAKSPLQLRQQHLLLDSRTSDSTSSLSGWKAADCASDLASSPLADSLESADGDIYTTAEPAAEGAHGASQAQQPLGKHSRFLGDARHQDAQHVSKAPSDKSPSSAIASTGVGLKPTLNQRHHQKFIEMLSFIGHARDESSPAMDPFDALLANAVQWQHGTLRIHLPHVQPHELPSDWQQRLQAYLQARHPGLFITSAAVWQGSTHIHIDLVFIPAHRPAAANTGAARPNSAAVPAAAGDADNDSQGARRSPFFHVLSLDNASRRRDDDGEQQRAIALREAGAVDMTTQVSFSAAAAAIASNGATASGANAEDDPWVQSLSATESSWVSLLQPEELMEALGVQLSSKGCTLGDGITAAAAALGGGAGDVSGAGLVDPGGHGAVRVEMQNARGQGLAYTFDDKTAQWAPSVMPQAPGSSTTAHAQASASLQLVSVTPCILPIPAPPVYGSTHSTAAGSNRDSGFVGLCSAEKEASKGQTLRMELLIKQHVGHSGSDSKKAAHQYVLDQALPQLKAVLRQEHCGALPGLPQAVSMGKSLGNARSAAGPVQPGARVVPLRLVAMDTDDECTPAGMIKVHADVVLKASDVVPACPCSTPTYKTKATMPTTTPNACCLLWVEIYDAADSSIRLGQAAVLALTPSSAEGRTPTSAATSLPLQGVVHNLKQQELKQTGLPVWAKQLQSAFLSQLPGKVHQGSSKEHSGLASASTHGSSIVDANNALQALARWLHAAPHLLDAVQRHAESTDSAAASQQLLALQMAAGCALSACMCAGAWAAAEQLVLAPWHAACNPEILYKYVASRDALTSSAAEALQPETLDTRHQATGPVEPMGHTQDKIGAAVAHSDSLWQGLLMQPVHVPAGTMSAGRLQYWQRIGRAAATLGSIVPARANGINAAGNVLAACGSVMGVQMPAALAAMEYGMHCQASKLLIWLAERDIAFPWHQQHAQVLQCSTRLPAVNAHDAGQMPATQLVAVRYTPLRCVRQHPGQKAWGMRTVLLQWARGAFEPTMQRLMLRRAVRDALPLSLWVPMAIGVAGLVNLCTAVHEGQWRMAATLTVWLWAPLAQVLAMLTPSGRVWVLQHAQGMMLLRHAMKFTSMLLAFVGIFAPFTLGAVWRYMYSPSGVVFELILEGMLLPPTEMATPRVFMACSLLNGVGRVLWHLAARREALRSISCIAAPLPSLTAATVGAARAVASPGSGMTHGSLRYLDVSLAWPLPILRALMTTAISLVVGRYVWRRAEKHARIAISSGRTHVVVDGNMNVGGLHAAMSS